MLYKLKRFFWSYNFLQAIIITLTMVVPVFVTSTFFNSIDIGITMALGVLFASASDVVGSNKHTFWGIFFSTLIAVIVTLLFGSLTAQWLIIVLMGIVVFAISFLSVFGFRASLVAFSGLFAMVLSFSNDYDKFPLLDYAFFTGLGGLVYLIVTYFSRMLFPQVIAMDKFVVLFEKTSQFLHVRGQLITKASDREALRKSLFQLQAELSETHQEMREMQLSNRSKSGFSNRTRRRLLLLSELIDILDLAIANPVDYEKLDALDKNYESVLFKFQELITAMADQLEFISKVIQKEEVFKVDDRISELLIKLDEEIVEYRDGIGLPKSRTGTLLLLNLKQYQEKQVQKIVGLDRVLSNVSKNESVIPPEEAHKFLTPQDYDFKKITNNLSFKSPIFRHSLRMSVVMVLGYCIGLLLEMQNTYWILLTIIVIMRPSYGLTKKRSQHRVIGTLIGALFSTIIIYITNDTTVYAVTSIIALPFTFALVKSNYRDAATAVTINVILLFALFEPNILEVIEYRIFDTIIGATLSFLAFYFLWPTWEYHGFSSIVVDTSAANTSFLREIKRYYSEKGEVSMSYKTSRRDAFLNIGNLNAAYQRLNQEPKSKQKDIATSYELVVLSNTFLSSLTSLGTFIRNNTTTKPSKEFMEVIKKIESNLETVVEIFKTKSVCTVEDTSAEEIAHYFDENFNKLAEKRDKEILSEGIFETQIVEELKEAQLVSEQVKWLFNLSEKLITMSNRYVSSRN